MPIPGMSYVTLTGSFVNLRTALPSIGQLRFTMPFQLVNTATNTIVVPGDFAAVLDSNGQFTISLPCTDDPDFIPADRFWQVTEAIDGHSRTYAVSLPASPSTVDLADIAPVDPVDPAAVYALLNGTYLVAGGVNQNGFGTLIGNRTTAAGVGGLLGLEVPVNFASPDATITQAASFYANFSGVPGPDQGTFEGGSAEANLITTGVWTPEGLGWEGIVTVAGSGSIGTTKAMQATAIAAGTATIGNLISMYGAGPFVSSGTPTVTNAYTHKAVEPTVGTNRYTWQGVGRHRMTKGVHAHAWELADASDLLQWSNSGALMQGYASNGVSIRLTLDPTDGTTTGRVVSELFGVGKHLSLKNSNSEVIGVGFDGKLTLAAAVDLILDATTGTKLGTAVTQKLGFWNATPIVQPAGASQAASVTTASTQTTPWGFSTQAQADGIVTLLNAIRLALVNAGIIKGAA